MKQERNTLREQVAGLAAERNESPLAIISQLQAGAAKIGADEVLDALCELKMSFIEEGVTK